MQILPSLLFLALGLALCPPAPPTPLDSVAQESAEQVVEGFERMLEAAAGEPSLERRAALLREPVAATHALGLLAGRLAGERWEAAGEGEREALGEAVGELCGALWASLVEGVPGARFVRARAPEPSEEAVRVHTRLEATGDARELEIALARTAAGWRIVALADARGGGFAELRAAQELEPEATIAELAVELRRRAARIRESPSAVVLRLQDALLAAMRGGAELGYTGRRALLAPVVEDAHDLAALSALVAGPAWRSFGEEQRRTLRATFGELSLATYAARFDAYSGESWSAPEESAVPRGGALVRSTFTKADRKQARFEYLLRREANRWRIVNIVVDGVSDLALKKTEYGKLIEERGFDALLEKLRAQIERYERGQKD